jgi:guanylate kinase
MIKLIFLFYLTTNVVTSEKTIDGERYYFINKDDIYVQYASKQEVLNWIQTKEFKYLD